MRLLVDEDFNHRIIRGLLRRMPGVDLVTVDDLGLRQTDDRAILEAAARGGRLLVSHDVNSMTAAFKAHQEAGHRDSGLLLIPQSMPIGQAIDEIELICAASDNDEWQGRMEFAPL